ncbi:DUF6192 family protein [Streptomyces sp. NPDC005132]|uniref:DUF6192 family protein n=1 Tax=Streptomyces sp. NPDC005132 TaxID=3154294 RepID=UPI0033B7161A
MVEETRKVGAVSGSRYEEIVAELQGEVEQRTRGQFMVGDRALEVEPLSPPGGSAAESAGPQQSLAQLAQDIGLPLPAVQQARWTASRWPVDQRRRAESFAVHWVLAGIEDDEERFGAIDDLPEGKTHWMLDDAKCRAGCETQ